MPLLLEDDLIYIRPYNKKDIPAFYREIVASLDDLLPWIEWANPNYRYHEAEQWINERQPRWQRQTEFDFGIFKQKTHELVGGVGLNAIFHEYRFANMGYWVSSQQTGQGFGARAARLLCQFAFENKKFNRVEISMAKENVASRKVAEKIPAHFEGELRQRLRLDNQYYDVLMYSILAS